MMKRNIIIAVTAVIALVALYLIAPGFSKNHCARITDFSVSEDGREMTLTIDTVPVGVAKSAPKVRKVKENQQFGGRLFLDCYSAFGGVYGTWGAKSEYVVELDEETNEICLYNGAYGSVLKKDSIGTWRFVN
ncbi:MAG: hypothetical protein IJE90_02890 [Clostridia bacterium]|nr:hypothetical protein [Clostridia bacterium]